MLCDHNIVLNFGANLDRQGLEETICLLKIHYFKSWLDFHLRRMICGIAKLTICFYITKHYTEKFSEWHQKNQRHNNPFAQLSDKCAIWADD